jgi:hypothetical protein
VITKGDTESSRNQQDCEDSEMKPRYAEIPQVKRHRRECEDKSANQERTRRPIDAASRNTQNQSGGNLQTITGSLISAEDYVFLCPRMNAAAVRAGELLCSYFGRLPAVFFYCLARISQL